MGKCYLKTIKIIVIISTSTTTTAAVVVFSIVINFIKNISINVLLLPRETKESEIMAKFTLVLLCHINVLVYLIPQLK